MTAYRATRRHTTGQRGNAPPAREFAAGGASSQGVAGAGFEPTVGEADGFTGRPPRFAGRTVLDHFTQCLPEPAGGRRSRRSPSAARRRWPRPAQASPRARQDNPHRADQRGLDSGRLPHQCRSAWESAYSQLDTTSWTRCGRSGVISSGLNRWATVLAISAPVRGMATANSIITRLLAASVSTAGPGVRCTGRSQVPRCPVGCWRSRSPGDERRPAAEVGADRLDELVGVFKNRGREPVDTVAANLSGGRALARKARAANRAGLEPARQASRQYGRSSTS
jgi:hypothetical protein